MLESTEWKIAFAFIHRSANSTPSKLLMFHKPILIVKLINKCVNKMMNAIENVVNTVAISLYIRLKNLKVSPDGHIV